MTVKTINVKGLPHEEREALIFPGVDNLAGGERLRLVVEFNPVPLVFLLKARNEFDISYEKEGPDEWILNITRTAPVVDQKEQFKQLLKEMKVGEVSEDTKSKAKQLLQAVDATSLGILEQELIREGVSHDEIRGSLCDIHLDIMRESLVAQRVEVEAPHPVHTLMEEHKIIISQLKEIDSIIEKLKGSKGFEGLGEDIERLKDISHHLVEAENHHKREEDVLFPMLEKHKIEEPPAIMRMDHVEFRKRKQELFKVTHNPQDYSFEEFRSKVTELGGYLSQQLEGHIFKEDNILYQIALQMLSQEEWAEVKKACDAIGYCCFTPQDLFQEGKMIDLDLRPIVIFERHDRIFEAWDAMKPGETLRITNDHDPKPLRYQFEVEYKDHYEWEYEQQGPRDWIVKIKKK